MWGSAVSRSVSVLGAFADVNSDSSVGNLPIEPPVETSVTRTQERVETAFTCDLMQHILRHLAPRQYGILRGRGNSEN